MFFEQKATILQIALSGHATINISGIGANFTMIALHGVR